MSKDKKIINDPVHGFISIPTKTILRILDHRFFQRLSRIKQLGLTYMVYPGAQHTRFIHSIGAMHLMSKALTVLRLKGVPISDKEYESAMIAILLHDIGHAPFSHVLESTFVSGISHEDISLIMMEKLDYEIGRMDMAVSMFKNEYPRTFFHQLISSHLDVDRLDYLTRDSYFTGVVEGVIGCERIISMMNVVDDNLVVESKGIYSLEKFLISRRMMYWQVYYHKASIAAEQVLVSLLRRAKYLSQKGVELFAPPSLWYFLYNEVQASDFIDGAALTYFSRFDDADIYSALRVWQSHSDPVLSILSECLTDRKLFKVKVFDEEPKEDVLVRYKDMLMSSTGLSNEDCDYLCTVVPVRESTYSAKKGGITILQSDGALNELSEVSDIFRNNGLSSTESKYYLCYYEPSVHIFHF